MLLCLEHAGLKLEVDTLGCWIKSFTFQDVPILQSTTNLSLDHAQPDTSGGFPLLPMANRVKRDQYTLGSETIQLDPYAPQGEYLHGDGWQSNWLKVNQTQQSLTLLSKHAHPNGYAYRAFITFSLGSIKPQSASAHEDGYEFLRSLTHTVLLPEAITQTTRFLKIELRIEHLGALDRLYGLGFHPYFACSPNQDRLYLNALGYCPEVEHHMSGPVTEDIPAPWDYRKTQVISPNFVNHCYVGFSHLTLYREKLAHLTAKSCVHMFSDMPYLMMYHALDTQFLALEPQSHCVDACNLAGRGGLKLLHTHDTLQHSLCIAI